MAFWRRATNPWDQDILIGFAWDLMWAAAIVGVVFLSGHALYMWLLAPEKKPSAPVGANEAAAGLPDRIVRHTVAARVFHWLMSVAMFVLLITAFFPVVGIQFAWVTIHWIAGLGLLLTVIYHIVHSIFWQDLRSMWISQEEIKGAASEVARFFKRSGEPDGKPGKYPLDHKLYHHAIIVVTTLAITTGLLMMFRVDTPFWARNPYLLSDQLWGVVYVVHGLSGVALITLVMAHIYFAIRPEKLWITRSMIKGWVRREEYLEHHDPKRWVVKKEDPPTLTGVAGSAQLREGVPQSKRSNN